MIFARVLIVLLLSATAAFAVPQLINYQGSLADSSGNALDTMISITFTIYDVPVGGVNLWTETHPSVAVQDGVFHVRLGSVTTLTDLFSVNRWLGITVGNNTEMVPRQQIVSVAHAYRVGTVDGAGGGIISGDVAITTRLKVGVNNNAGGLLSSVTGGNSNNASGDYAIIGGGLGNTAGGARATVGGGDGNSASAGYTAVGGGDGNDASFDYAAVGGGNNNTASGWFSVVDGGNGNTAASEGAAVGGGAFNSASAAYATVAGGYNNAASVNYAAVSGGHTNHAMDDYAAVTGGLQNTADYLAQAGGYRARARHSGSFVWGSSNSPTDSTASFNNYSVTFRCANGARFYTAHTGTTTGVSLAAGGGSWSSLSDSSQKENLHEVNTTDILTKLEQLKITEWNYKSQDQQIRHLGPMAQDFSSAFGLGESSTSITTVDADGVLFAAVQELAKQNQNLKQELAELKTLVRSHLQFGMKQE